MDTEKQENPPVFTSEVISTYINTFLQEVSTLYIVIGTDSGELPLQLDNNNIPDGTCYLFIEAESEYSEITQHLKVIRNPNIVVAPFSNWYEIASGLDIKQYLYANNLNILRALSSINYKSDEYSLIQHNLSEEIRQLTKELRSETQQIYFHEKIIENAVDNIFPVQNIAQKANGTAIVLGAGPSLDDLLPWISSNQDKLTIIAVSRIYRQLKASNISPDILVSVDPLPVNYEQSKSILNETKALFIHSNHVSPQLLSQWKGNAYFMGNRFPWESKHNIENINTATPTVSHSGVNIAISLGFEQILLAGIDLCLSSSGKTHSNSEFSVKYSEEDTFNVETYAGDIRETTFAFNLGIKKLEELVQNYPGEIFNLSVNAAKVDGIEFIQSPQLKHDKCSLHSDDKTTIKLRSQHLKMVNAELIAAQKQYNEILKLCKKAIDLNLAPEKILDPNKHQSNQVKIDNIEHKLNTKFQKYMPLIQAVSSAELLRLLKKTDRTSISNSENYHWLNQYYQAYIDGTVQLLNAIKKGKQIVVSRLNEFKLPYSYEKIIQHWDTNEEYGRSCLYLSHNDTVAIPEDFQKSVTDHCIFFNSLIKQDAKFKKILIHLTSTRIEKISEKLQNNLINSYAHYKNTDHSDPKCQIFLKGLINHLEDNKENALSCYQLIFKDHEINLSTAPLFINDNFAISVIQQMSEIDVMAGLDAIAFVINGIDNSNISAPLSIHIKNKFDLQIKHLYIKSLRENISVAANAFFEQKNIGAFQRLLNKSSILFDNKNNRWFNQLLYGMLYQLENKNAEASALYSENLDGMLPNGIENSPHLHHPDLRDTLLQMLTISNPEETINIYYLLNEISEEYCPQLADALASNGELEQAIYFYQDFVNKHRTNIDALNKLRDLYKLNKNLDLADQVSEIISKLKILMQLPDKNTEKT